MKVVKRPIKLVEMDGDNDNESICSDSSSSCDDSSSSNSEVDIVVEEPKHELENYDIIDSDLYFAIKKAMSLYMVADG